MHQMTVSRTATNLTNMRQMSEWLKAVAKIRTSNEEFYRLFHQALEDMAALRLPIKGTDHMVFMPTAGLPWFVVPSGRDSLLVPLQNFLIYPEFARGSLEILGSLQAKEDDPYRAAAPHRIQPLHGNPLANSEFMAPLGKAFAGR